MQSVNWSYLIYIMNKKAEKIIEEFMRDAGPDEIRELEFLLKQRDGKGSGPRRDHKGTMDLSSMARDTADAVRKQLGVTEKMIQETARNLVVSLARQYQPDITDRELSALLTEMLPSFAASKKLPPDILLAMVEQFVEFSTGGMIPEDAGENPAEWIERYWREFPGDVRSLIRAYLNGESDSRVFWNGIHRCIRA